MSEGLINIPSPAELKSMSTSQLAELAAIIRKRLIQVTSVNGGHLASSLGAVELILALHRVFDSPADRLVFDVGHQAYAHKLITGRQHVFDTLRTYGGISGFTRREESEHDSYDSGHASDSLSIALGMALARNLNRSSQHIAVLIGDAALSGGMAFEALNQIGQLQPAMTILLNDNEMSISRNVGALSLHLGKARMSKTYTTLRDTVEDKVSSAGKVGKSLMRAGDTAKSSFKKLMVPGTFFEDMGIVYIGPIDGHNIEVVSEALRISKKAQGPVLIHAITQKGRGFAPAEMQPERFHGVSGYNPKTGKFNGKKGQTPTYTEVFSQAIVDEAKTNEDIVVITAAMTDGTGLAQFKKEFPERFFDVGIAEEHAVALAGGLALSGKTPVVAIYSTFLQRAYDQLMINVALQDAHVVFCVDRAGIVGEDGTTHHGLYDLAYLRSIPGMRIIAPADDKQMRDALHTALVLKGAPVALRYPRGAVPEVGEGFCDIDSAGDGTGDGTGDGASSSTSSSTSSSSPSEPVLLVPGKAIQLTEGKGVSILAIGRMVEKAKGAALLLSQQGIQASVTNMLWLKPIDEDTIVRAARAPLIVTLEEGTVSGGFGSAVLEVLARHSLRGSHSAPRVMTIGVEDCFVKHGSIENLFEELGLNAHQIAERIQHALQGEGQTD